MMTIDLENGIINKQKNVISCSIRILLFIMMLQIVLMDKIVFSMKISPPKIAVIGGGASGMFASISAGEAFMMEDNMNCKISVYEGGRKLMTKVAISGGGRCNVLHDTNKSINEILSNYPRGYKELNGLLSKRFTPSNARTWFENKGVQLKIEKDGRMFPISDSSQTIMDALLNAAIDTNLVNISTNKRVIGISKDDNDGLFTLHFSGDDIEKVDCVILATGSSPIGHTIAKQLGHDITKPVPSLFTLNSNKIVKNSNAPFHDLAGVSVPKVKVTFRVKVPGNKRKKKKVFEEIKPILITHQGFSGPAILRLSAFAAREFYDTNYNCSIQCHWIPDLPHSTQDIFDLLWKQTKLTPSNKRLIVSPCPLLHNDDNNDNNLPRRLWKALVLYSDISETLCWVDASKKQIMKLAKNIAEFEIPIEGKSTFKEEFVTCGGIPLKQINMKSMESKICNGLFFCGEIIDVDGVTGGFNFMNCWSTGYVSGNAAVQHVIKQHDHASLPT